MKSFFLTKVITDSFLNSPTRIARSTAASCGNEGLLFFGEGRLLKIMTSLLSNLNLWKVTTSNGIDFQWSFL